MYITEKYGLFRDNKRIVTDLISNPTTSGQQGWVPIVPIIFTVRDISNIYVIFSLVQINLFDNWKVVYSTKYDTLRAEKKKQSC